MSDWSLQRLGAHADVKARIGWRGLSSDEYTDNGPYLIAGKHIVNGKINWQSCDHVSEWRYDESPEIALRDGDVVVTKDGTIGRVARVDTLPGPATLNGTMMLVRPHKELDHRFLAHSLGGQAFQRLIADRISGSSIPHLFQRDLVQLELRMPLLEEQRRIAEVLDTMDEAIRATERVIAKHERIRTGIAAVLLGGNPVGLLPANQESTEAPPSAVSGGTAPTLAISEWRQLRLGDIGLIVGGGTPSRQKTEYWGGSIPWLTPGELTRKRSKFVYDSQDRITDLGLSASGAKLLPAESLMITSRASIGFCALAGVSMATNQGFKNLVPGDEVDPSYLYFLGQTLAREMIRRASGTTFLEISGSEFKRIEIRLPPLDQQRHIAGVLDTSDEVIRAHTEQRAKLWRLRAGLSADLLSGRVRTVVL